MRAVMILLFILLVPSVWTPAVAQQDAGDCLDLRGHTRNPRLLNRCSYEINVLACCRGQGALNSCQGGNFEPILIEPGGAVSISSCDNNVVTGACRAPAYFDNIRWDAEIDNVRSSPCKSEPTMSSADQIFTWGKALSLERSDMRNADLAGKQMRGEDLSEVDLHGANIESANLDGANLFLADLTDANLKAASLKGANLQFAKLQGADFSGADLSGANIDGAHLRGTIFCQTIMPDGTVNDEDCS